MSQQQRGHGGRRHDPGERNQVGSGAIHLHHQVGRQSRQGPIALRPGHQLLAVQFLQHAVTDLHCLVTVVIGNAGNRL
ncbi:hypothetical protein D9M68_708600 [compost metagenome]